MKKLITTLMCTLVGGTLLAQWTPTSATKVDRKQKSGELTVTDVRGYYKLDLDLLRSQLNGAQEMGKNAKPVVISIPTLNGKIEKFNVYSFPVVVKSLADRYQLGSYIGASIDDPSRTIRFSVSPRGFNSMIMQDGQYEFIDPQNSDKTVYGIHPKTMKSGDKSFLCSTNESPAAVKAIEKMLEKGKSFTNQVNDFSKMSDKKYRTMRLAMSVTAEYTIYHGGTLQGAVDAISATMTRVNGVFEKDFALHLNVQDFPGIIYFNAATDPYSDSTSMGDWNVQLQQTLTANVQNENYDIGHLFGASGGGGNAGCIGCVCINPASANDTAKGSGYTSPANGQPEGDTFDIDYVAHEMGHQLGANHTFSHNLEGAGVNQEPGSGSTIMGYAGITGGPNTDVQPNSDAYFHNASIRQVQANLIEKNCDVETPVTNNPPAIVALPTYNIPKATAFVLTASATDPENDPMTYTWEQIDNANLSINKNNLGKTTSGASFRSLAPTTSPSRYFPKFSSVLSGTLDNSSNTWESVSMVPRTSKFAVTVRDNHTPINQQQTQYAEQTIIVKDDGPFRLAAQFADVNTPTPIQWVVANTNAAPYNVANVKIDYTADNGVSWTVLSPSTPNDGSENFTFPSSMNGQTIKVRVAAIGNVFYALGSVALTPLSPCSSAAPTNIVVSYITTTSASVSWMSYTGATYKFRYKKTTGSVWTEMDVSVPSVNLSNLDDGATYEVQVATVCSGTTGTYSASVNFSTNSINYCTGGGQFANDEYISNVTLANVNNTTQLGGGYNNYTTNTALQINLTKGSTYPLSVTLSRVGAPDYDGIAAFIDFNRDGTFDNSERVLNFPIGIVNAPVTSTVAIPADAVEGKPLRMRVVGLYAGVNNAGYSLPATWTCGIRSYGEIEDYNIVISPAPLSTSETSIKNNDIQIYPNPVADVLNVTKVSDKAAYKIYNAAGQLVNSGNINNGKINVSTLVKGGYVITIDEKGIEPFRSKFIKK